jgi:hypothetical protein
MKSFWLATAFAIAIACASRSASRKAVPSCPTTWAEASAARFECPVDSHSSCAYPQGTCGCQLEEVCRGTPPPKDEVEKTVWHCEPTPAACPPPGACTDGDTCNAKQGCCVRTYSCVDGAWDMGQKSCPP